MSTRESSILPLRLSGVTYRVGERVLIAPTDVEFDPRGRSVIIGPNGAGKSLLLRLCHGLIQPSEGRIEWLGSKAGQARRHQAMVFQRPVMLRRSTAANIDYPLSLRGLKRRYRRERIAAVLAQSGLAPMARQPARTLSGGEQQRLALARAWVIEPEVLFLDEPTANLDPGATRAIESIIDAIAQAGTKIIMTTHDLGQAKRLGDEILFLNEGRIAERRPAEEFFAGPRDPAARAFLEGRLWNFTRKEKPR